MNAPSYPKLGKLFHPPAPLQFITEMGDQKENTLEIHYLFGVEGQYETNDAYVSIGGRKIYRFFRARLVLNADDDESTVRRKVDAIDKQISAAKGESIVRGANCYGPLTKNERNGW